MAFGLTWSAVGRVGSRERSVVERWTFACSCIRPVLGVGIRSVFLCLSGVHGGPGPTSSKLVPGVTPRKVGQQQQRSTSSCSGKKLQQNRLD